VEGQVCPFVLLMEYFYTLIPLTPLKPSGSVYCVFFTALTSQAF
jgi:hypothetical protein